MMGIVLALALQPAAGTPDGWPSRMETLEAPNGPVIVAYLQPESELVALRLSIPVRERPAAVSGVVAHQYLVRGRLERDVARVGGQAETSRTAGHAVYAVAGPARELDELAAALRRAVGFAPAHAGEVAAAWQRAEAAALAELETPGTLVRRRLWERFDDGRDAGHDLTVVPGPEAVEAFWSTHYVPARMRAVVVGGVTKEAVLSALGDWPVPGATPLPAVARQPPLRRDPSPQLAAAWVGLAYSGHGLDVGALAVASRLADAALAGAGLRSPAAELWLAGDHAAVILVAAAPVGERASDRGTDVAARMREVLAGAAAGVTDAQVARARYGWRRELHLAARTPQGLAALIGDFADRTGDPAAAGRFLADLAAVDTPAVARVLETLAARSPLTAEVLP